MSDIVARLLASAEHSERCGWLTHAQLDREAAQTFIEVAAFLDRMAESIEGNLEGAIEANAADCRAMARRLRGET
jgi:hypothetical protein